MIVCVHLPRFALIVAAGGAGELSGRAVAISPAGGSRQVGETSPAAQAKGVHAGMRLGEALARCPELILIHDDPVGVTQEWEAVLLALEGIGAQVEAAQPGLAYFIADGLLGLYRGLGGLLAAVRAGVNRPSRIGVGRCRFVALAASFEARPRRARIIEDRDARRYLAGQPVSLLGHRERAAALLPALERLGISTLGQLARIPVGQLADRFGQAGILAGRLAVGHDEPLCPRRYEEHLEESMRVSELNSYGALERTLGVLVDRLLARPERHGRAIGAVRLAAELVEHAGTWSETVVFAAALTSGRRMRDALQGKLALLPVPATRLTLRIAVLAPGGGAQTSLLEEQRTVRVERLSGALAQARAAAGPHAALRVVMLSPDARVPERTHTYTPFLP